MSDNISAASASVGFLRKLIDEGGFAVALSGGGHRAALATLGALMAIVDRGLGSKIIQVASVSGGSITNAFVAQRCRLEKLGPGEIDDIARELATSIISKGVLTGGRIAVLIVTPIILAVIVGVVLYKLLIPWTWLAVVIGVVTALVILISRGIVIEWLLDHRYFRQSSGPQNRSFRSRARIASLSGRQVDHVFCMTDLVLGLPVYASSQHGGMMWRRLALKPTRDSYISFQTFGIGQLSIATLVRASAGFPGIPPRRLRIPSDPQIELVAASPSLAFLADGGLWNNLGSQVIREDGFIGSYSNWDRGVLRPYGTAPTDIPLLCINGSAPHRPARSWMFHIPGIALFKSLMQVTNILNTNTVLPRVGAMTESFTRRTGDGTRPGHGDPADLVVDLRSIEDIQDDYRMGTWSEELIRKSDPVVKKFEWSELNSLDRARDSLAKGSGSDELKSLLGPQQKATGSYPVVGLATIDDWDQLLNSPHWKLLQKSEAQGRVEAPTTLGRMERGLARRLIARAYLNTYLVSLFLKPLSEGELDGLATFSERLDKIAGAESVER